MQDGGDPQARLGPRQGPSVAPPQAARSRTETQQQWLGNDIRRTKRKTVTEKPVPSGGSLTTRRDVREEARQPKGQEHWKGQIWASGDHDRGFPS